MQRMPARRSIRIGSSAEITAVTADHIKRIDDERKQSVGSHKEREPRSFSVKLCRWTVRLKKLPRVLTDMPASDQC